MIDAMRLARGGAEVLTMVHAATATVRHGGAPVDLSWRERKLAIAIASAPRAVLTETLARLLFPDRDDEDAGKTVKVYVYRLRRRIAADFVVRRDGGYALGPHVAVDIVQAQQIIQQLSRDDAALDDDRRRCILDLARELRSECPTALLESEWCEAIARRSRRLGHDLAMAVGGNAARHGAYRAACSIGQELTYEDPCDEEAWELLIRAQLGHGEHAAAFRNFRCYETMLAQELDAAPSVHVRKLIHDARIELHAASKLRIRSQ